MPSPPLRPPSPTLSIRSTATHPYRRSSTSSTSSSTSSHGRPGTPRPFDATALNLVLNMYEAGRTLDAILEALEARAFRPPSWHMLVTRLRHYGFELSADRAVAPDLHDVWDTMLGYCSYTWRDTRRFERHFRRVLDVDPGYVVGGPFDSVAWAYILEAYMDGLDPKWAVRDLIRLGYEYPGEDRVRMEMSPIGVQEHVEVGYRETEVVWLE